MPPDAVAVTMAMEMPGPVEMPVHMPVPVEAPRMAMPTFPHLDDVGRIHLQHGELRRRCADVGRWLGDDEEGGGRRQHPESFAHLWFS